MARQFPQVPRQKLAETVAQQVRDSVRDAEPGTQLPSLAELTAQLGVGRSTLREAINGLAMMGIVEVRHGQGVFVAQRPSGPTATTPVVEFTPEIVEARNLIEVELAALAAQRRTESDLKGMMEVLARHARRLERSEGPIVEASQFHLLLIDAAGNEVLAGVVRPFLQFAFEHGPALYQTEEGYADWELDQHQGIFETIRSADPEMARARMREHVVSMKARYLSVDDVESRRATNRWTS